MTAFTKPDGWPSIPPRQWRRMSSEELGWYLDAWERQQRASRG